ncbi:MAG: FecR domain-containing protein [Nitrospirae bacterium]|nr:FecR domain-containing protein [Nitrospirota bacterium]
MKRVFLLSLFACFCFNAVVSAAQDEIIGEVKKVKGTATITQGSETANASVGTKVYKKAVLKTSKDSSMSFTLKDNTVLSMGPDSVLSVESFAFVPQDKNLSLLAKMNKGSATYSSGTIGKLAPEAVKIDTPDMSIGIRGTYFLVNVTE